MAQPLAAPFSYFADSNGAPLAGGLIYTYAAGTTTPQASYTDSTGTVPAANPVVLDSAGRASIWLIGFYKIVVKDSLGNTIHTDDNISGTSTSAVPWAVAGGTVDAITVTYNPAITTLTDGLQLAFRASGANATTTPTFAPNGLTAHTITQKGGSALVAGNITANLAEYIVTYNLANTRWELLNPTAVLSLLPQDFRITLTNGVAVTFSDVTGATTLYMMPYLGNNIALYDGVASWNVYQSTGTSLALGTLTSGLPYDVFCYANGTAPTLEFLAWTNGTTRATALASQNGIYVKTGATTRRYLGTFYTTSTTATEDSLANRYLWNYYNRVNRPIRVSAITDYTYQTATWRQAGGSTANQLNFVIGAEEEPLQAQVITSVANSGGTTVDAGVAIALDSTTTPSTACLMGATQITSGTAPGQPVMAFLTAYPVPGVHYAAWLEISKASGTTTWYHNGGTTFTNTGGISGVIRG